MVAMFSSFIKDPPKTEFAGEDTGEKVLYVIRRSFVTNLGWIIIGIFLILIPIIMSIVMASLGLSTGSILPPTLSLSATMLWYLFTFGFFFERFLDWYFNVYIITNKRIVDMDFFGLLNMRVSDAPLQNIQDISYDIRGFVEAMFNYGDVVIQTAAERPNFDFESVDNPAHVQDILSDLVRGINNG